MSEDVTHTHTHEYYSAMRKKEVLPFATRWVDLECIMLSKSEKDRYCVCDITYLWSLKNDTNALIYEIETFADMEKKRIVTKGERLKWV